MKYELTVVKGNNAYCPMCYDEINTPPYSVKKHEKGVKESALPKGTTVLKIETGSGSRSTSNFLCMKHAREMRTTLNDWNLWVE
ncbi:MAG: hypothetical protein M0R80_02235 [Proteobacteria bacterium]|jgi:hypothetical protein|nr:hypothetical protein [Pseudomonadota bacterium]